jgi:two-component system sensor histidine kinase YesM
VAALYISIYLSKKYTTPITSMQDSMKHVEDGDLHVHLEPVGEDEFADLAKSFNHMVKRIRALINVVYEKQVQLRKSEYKALEAQINPHFLYNSLDSIIWLLKMGQSNDAIIMLNNLVILFRIALSKGNELISIQKEIQHIESYLIIQSMRYSKKFDYRLDVPEKFTKYKTLKLLLQPLVENAIYHGLSEDKPKLTIEVDVMGIYDRIIFVVKDNGAGIPPKKLDKLKDILQDDDMSDNDSDSYGLRNVNGRIKAYFGSEYGLTVDSVLGEGTTIFVSIPRTTDDELYNV